VRYPWNSNKISRFVSTPGCPANRRFGRVKEERESLCYFQVICWAIMSTDLCNMKDGRRLKLESHRTLKIDIDGLCTAIDDNSWEHYYYLSLETGEIVFISDYMDEEEAEKLRSEIDGNLNHYKPIPRAEPYEGYEDMADFIRTVEDERLRELLEVAINGKGAFRRFKDVLTRYADERENWFRFKDDKVRQRALEWLESIGVSLENG